MNLTLLKTLAPAAFTDHPAPHVSGKYTHVRTADVLETFANEGWDWASATQQKTKAEGKEKWAKHQIVLRPGNEVVDDDDLGGLRPRIKIINSGDWSSRLEIYFMLWRLVCSNGMHMHVTVQGYNVRHDQIKEDLNEVLIRFPSASKNMIQKANAMHAVQLTHADLLNFSTSAAKLRFGDAATFDHSQALLTVRRVSDEGNSLWNVLNRVQENGIKGGLKLGSMKRPIRELTNIAATRDFNVQLSELADRYLTNRN